MMNFSIPSVPGEFAWHIHPLDWKFDSTKGLSIVAGEQTDWFANPDGSAVIDNAPCALMTPPDANFLLSAKVSVDFASAFDAGVLQIRCKDNLGAKLCFEYSPQGHPMVVSVVTRAVSDDCNSVEIAQSEIYLRLARTLKTVAFHYSHDGHVWQFVRYFRLGECDDVRVGFSAQSPTGKQCKVVFSEMTYRPGTLKDNRSGE